MLEIHIVGEDRPLVVTGSLTELLRTAHVVADVAFIEPVNGNLVNLTAVTRIVEQDEPNGTGYPAPMLGREDPPVRVVDPGFEDGGYFDSEASLLP